MAQGYLVSMLASLDISATQHRVVFYIMLKLLLLRILLIMLCSFFECFKLNFWPYLTKCLKSRDRKKEREMLKECGKVPGEWKSLQCLTSIHSLHPNTPDVYLFLLSAALPENMQLCKCISFCTRAGLFGRWRQACSRVRVIHCVCVIRADVCRETDCKHRIKLCLLSFWVSFIDSPLELALIIYQVLYHEGRAGIGDRMYLDRPWSFSNKVLWFVTF